MKSSLFLNVLKGRTPEKIYAPKYSMVNYLFSVSKIEKAQIILYVMSLYVGLQISEVSIFCTCFNGDFDPTITDRKDHSTSFG